MPEATAQKKFSCPSCGGEMIKKGNARLIVFGLCMMALAVIAFAVLGAGHHPRADGNLASGLGHASQRALMSELRNIQRMGRGMQGKGIETMFFQFDSFAHHSPALNRE